MTRNSSAGPLKAFAACANRISSIRLPELNPLTQLRDVFAIAHLRWLMLVLLLYALPFSILTLTATVLLKESLSWNILLYERGTGRCQRNNEPLFRTSIKYYLDAHYLPSVHPS